MLRSTWLLVGGPVALMLAGHSPLSATALIGTKQAPAELSELVRRANAWTSAALHASGNLTIFEAGADGGETYEVDLLVTRAAGLRVRGRAVEGGADFDLASDGLTLSIRLAGEGKLYRGSANSKPRYDPRLPFLSLRPQELTEALLPQPLRTRSDPSKPARVLIERYPDGFQLSWLRPAEPSGPRVRRRLWMDADFQVTRMTEFLADGRVALEALYNGYVTAAADAYPRQVEVVLPWEKLHFRFVFEAVDRRPQLGDHAFVLVPEPGERTLSLSSSVVPSSGQRSQPRSALFPVRVATMGRIG